jgi:hypothetical protein
MTRIIEKRLQMVAHRLGLRVIADRYAGRVTGQYLLRPASDARSVVQLLPDGNYSLASFWENGRRYIGTRFSIDEVEKFLARYEPIPVDLRRTGKISRRPVNAPVQRRSKRDVRGLIGARVGPVDLTQTVGPS